MGVVLVWLRGYRHRTAGGLSRGLPFCVHDTSILEAKEDDEEEEGEGCQSLAELPMIKHVPDTPLTLAFGKESGGNPSLQGEEVLGLVPEDSEALPFDLHHRVVLDPSVPGSLPGLP